MRLPVSDRDAVTLALIWSSCAGYGRAAGAAVYARRGGLMWLCGIAGWRPWFGAVCQRASAIFCWAFMRLAV